MHDDSDVRQLRAEAQAERARFDGHWKTDFAGLLSQAGRRAQPAEVAGAQGAQDAVEWLSTGAWSLAQAERRA